MKHKLLSPLLAAALAAAVALTAAALPAFADGGEETPITIGQSQEQAECTCTALCTGDSVNADCPVCGAEGADLNKCKGFEAQPATLSNALPVTALAAAPSGQELYVGDVQISSTGYWTTDSDGNVTASTAGETPTDNYISYDAENNVLTLHNATIKNELEVNASIEGGTFINGSAIGVFNKSGNAELTISLVGTNTIANVGKGIFVLANSASTGSSNLTIQGDGSLNASASQTGIWVQSNSNNAALCVENAEVTASADGAVKNGVLVQAKDGSDVSLTVNGGSLTASVNANIWFQFGSGASGSGTPTVTVSNNAIVRANGGIANNSSSPIQYETGSDSTGGIVFDGKNGTVYGSVTLQEDLTIGEGESLTIGEGASLDTNGKTITVESGGKLEGNIPTNGVVYKVTGVTLSETTLTLDVGESDTLTATITPSNATDQNVTWSSDNESVATVDQNGRVTAVGTGSTTITATAADGSGKSAECSVTVKEAANVPVESVSLDKTSLGLTEGETAQLTATVEPEDASNKNVTWESSNTNVATVNNGEVTAVSAGTATITVTTVDGGKTDTCTVTVREEAPDRPVNIPDTHEIDLIVGEGGKAKLSLTNASAGSTITVTATPDAGYELDYITVDGERIDGTTFTMPDHDVTVRVYFTDGAALPFTDVSAGAWYFDAVGYVYVGGLMDGVSDTLFDPDGTMTRAMVWAILARVDGETVTGDGWIETARDWAVANGVSDGENATDYVTREQFATMLWRYASGKGYDVSIGEDTNILSYADFADLSEYAIPAMQWACGAGVITGVTDATLVPQGEATRAQCAAMLMRFVEAIG